MFRANESPRFQAPVEVQRRSGTLYLLDSRIGFVADGERTLSIPIDFKLVKTQQVSKAGAKRVMLKLILSEPVAGHDVYTFAFTSTDQALAQRDRFKDVLIHAQNQLRDPTAAAGAGGMTPSVSTPGSRLATPAAARPAVDTPSPYTLSLTPKLFPSNGALAPTQLTREAVRVRQQILSKNRHLAKLHKDLVQAGYIPEEEFWATRQDLLASEGAVQSQQKGHSSAWPEMIPMANNDGQGFTYHLSRDKLMTIFQQHPRVEQAFRDNVPHNMSEEDFWKRFFASKIFHRNRAAATNEGATDEVFDQCLEEEEREEAEQLTKRLKLGNLHRLLDMSQTEEDHVETGNVPNFSMQPGKVVESRSLIRSFNRHSQIVLRAHLDEPRPNADDSIEKEILIDDLQAHPDRPTTRLDIADEQRYLESQGQSSGTTMTTTTTATANSTDPLNPGTGGIELVRQFAASVSTMNSRLYENLLSDPSVPTAVLGELWGRVRDNAQIHVARHSPNLGIPADLQAALLSCHVTGFEMLRHLWASLVAVPMTDDKVGRATKIVDAIRLVGEHIEDVRIQARPLGEPVVTKVQAILVPLETAIQGGLDEYEKVKAKRG
ncbi:RNA polymerase II transcription factor B subunit 1 [Tieghemiomyces parasiticus]|uniref:RNA polymerase II transcription factor B subunit 1 n=1 Tax=Tieghemiomyces parasiticus TaxID=78921 RepID=A0A9W8ALB2_9FUNG|nr:RNA polymerase II transcription factor B subunit 1 [Tieghemiomyces parasiticus]